MEKTLQCPKCGSTEIETRDHDKLLKTTGGVLLTAAGTFEQTSRNNQRHEILPNTLIFHRHLSYPLETCHLNC